MSLVIENPVAVEQLNAFATSRGLTVDEAIIKAIDAANGIAVERRKTFEQALEKLAEIMGPMEPGVVIDDSRESYYVDDHGRLPGMNGYGQSE